MSARGIHLYLFVFYFCSVCVGSVLSLCDSRTEGEEFDDTEVSSRPICAHDYIKMRSCLLVAAALLANASAMRVVIPGGRLTSPAIDTHRMSSPVLVVESDMEYRKRIARDATAKDAEQGDETTVALEVEDEQHLVAASTKRQKAESFDPFKNLMHMMMPKQSAATTASYDDDDIIISEPVTASNQQSTSSVSVPKDEPKAKAATMPSMPSFDFATLFKPASKAQSAAKPAVGTKPATSTTPTAPRSAVNTAKAGAKGMATDAKPVARPAFDLSTLFKQPPPPAAFELPELCAHVAMDGTIYRSQVYEAAERLDGPGSWCPVLIFVPLRLGLEDINADYAPSLAALFSLPQSLGILGGKPRMAHYFVGVAGARLLLLDPHTVQPALSPDQPDITSCHLSSPNVPSMPLLDLDPSLALGFLCESRRSFDALCAACLELSRACLVPFAISDRPIAIPHDLDERCADDTGEEDEDEGMCMM